MNNEANAPTTAFLAELVAAQERTAAKTAAFYASLDAANSACHDTDHLEPAMSFDTRSIAPTTAHRYFISKRSDGYISASCSDSHDTYRASLPHTYTDVNGFVWSYELLFSSEGWSEAREFLTNARAGAGNQS